MADKKISELPSASALTGTEIVPLVQGGATDKTTTQDIADLAINSIDLQSVTDNGNTTIDDLIVQDGDYVSSVKKQYIESKNIITNQSAILRSDAKLQLQNNFVTGLLGITNLTNSIQLEFPDKTAGNYTIATTDDVSGLVPYTGATSDVDLDTHILSAQSVNVKGTSGNGHLGLKHQSADATASANETVIFAGSDGEPRYKNDGGAIAQFASRAWVTAQGYITNVITALGYTPVPTTRIINGYDLSANRTLTASDVSAVASNGAITGATKTKITYDSKGLVTSGADATTADISDSTNKRYVTDAQLTVIGNTSGNNTGDETKSSILSKLEWWNIQDQIAGSNSIGTTNTITKSIALPNVPSILNFRAVFLKTGTNNTWIARAYISEVNNNIGGTAVLIATSPLSNATSVYLPIKRTVDFIDNNIIAFPQATAAFTDDSQINSILNTAFPTGTPLYLIFTVQCLSASDTASLRSVQINNFTF